jgi:hypothetical protein
VINEGEITFTPTLPAAKVAAFQPLNMYKGDGGTAVLLKWDTVDHWNQYAEWYINDGPAGNCWMDALHKDIPAAEKVIWKCILRPDDYANYGMSAMTDQEIVDAVATDFAEGFPTMSLSNLVDSMIFRPTEHPSFYGSYSSPGFNSYPTTGHSARVESGLPVGTTACHKLYFAGEANHDPGAALVHAAVETGWRAALEIDADITPGSCGAGGSGGTGGGGGSGGSGGSGGTGGGGGTMHVDNIVVVEAATQGPWRVGSATIAILDGGGSPVSGATVDASYSGSTSGSTSGTTDGSGNVTLQSSENKRSWSGQFCVDNVTLGGSTYSSGHNVETCDTL